MHNRTPQTISVPISALKADPSITTEDRFVQNYISMFGGKIKVSLTRLDINNINTGFFSRSSDGSISHISNINSSGVDAIQNMICGGMRPSVDLHWDPHAPNGGGLACPDHENTLAAYVNLGINLGSGSVIAELGGVIP